MAWNPKGSLKGPKGDAGTSEIIDVSVNWQTEVMLQGVHFGYGSINKGVPASLFVGSAVMRSPSVGASWGVGSSDGTFWWKSWGGSWQQAVSQSTLDTTISGLITQTITNGDTTHSPSGDAVFDALATKADDSNVVHNTGAETIAGLKTFTDNLTVATGPSNGKVAVSSITGQISDFALQSNGVDRWVLRCQNDVELGSNTGSSFSLRSRDDTGAQLNTIFQVDRPTGVLNFPQVAPTILGNTIWHAGNSKLDSGNLTPNCTGVSNAASCSANLCSFMRVGNSVTYSGSVSVTPSAANAASIVSIALPVASNFSSGTDASGPVTGKAAGIPSFEVGQIFAEAGTGRLRVHFYPATTNDYTMRFCIVYPIL